MEISAGADCRPLCDLASNCHSGPWLVQRTAAWLGSAIARLARMSSPRFRRMPATWPGTWKVKGDLCGKSPLQEHQRHTGRSSRGTLVYDQARLSVDSLTAIHEIRICIDSRACLQILQRGQTALRAPPVGDEVTVDVHTSRGSGADFRERPQIRRAVMTALRKSQM